MRQGSPPPGGRVSALVTRDCDCMTTITKGRAPNTHA